MPASRAVPSLRARRHRAPGATGLRGSTAAHEPIAGRRLARGVAAPAARARCPLPRRRRGRRADIRDRAGRVGERGGASGGCRRSNRRMPRCSPRRLPRALKCSLPDAATRDTAVACDQLVANFQAAASAEPGCTRWRGARGRTSGRPAIRRPPPTGSSRSSTWRPGAWRAPASTRRPRAGRCGCCSATRTSSGTFGIALAGDSTRVRIPLRDTLSWIPSSAPQLTREGESGGQGGREHVRDPS